MPRSTVLRRAALAGIVSIALGPPLWAGATTFSRRLTPSTAMRLEAWLKERVPADRVVLVEDGWLDLRDAPFTTLRVPDLAWALDPARYVSTAADYIVVPETRFSEPALAGLPLVGRVDASRRFAGSLGFDYRVYRARPGVPVETVEIQLGAPESAPAVGREWDPRASGGPGLLLPDRSAVVFLPPLAGDELAIDLDLANAGNASSPLPVVVSLVTARERKVDLTDSGPPAPGLRRLSGHLQAVRAGRGLPIRLDPVRRGARLRVVAIRVGPPR